MLGAIGSSDNPPTAPQIGERMGISRQGVQKQLNLLLEEKLIETRDNAAHKRSPGYVLSPAGRQRLDHINGRWQEQGARDYPPEALSAALAVLEILAHQLQSPEQP